MSGEKKLYHQKGDKSQRVEVISRSCCGIALNSFRDRYPTSAFRENARCHPLSVARSDLFRHEVTNTAVNMFAGGLRRDIPAANPKLAVV